MDETVMNVQAFLRGKQAAGEDALAALTAEFAIKVTRSKVHPSLVSLKYSQLDSPKLAPIVRECRGVILDTEDDFKVVARGFDRFYNAGEYGADPIDWSQATVQEKRDGSLILAYVYKGDLRWSSSGSVDVHEPQNSMLKLAAIRSHDEIAEHFVGSTLIFELTGADNRVVIPYGEAFLTLLGVRDNATGYDSDPDTVKKVAAHFGYKTPKTFSFASQKEAEDSLADMRGLQGEGYVVQSPGATPGKINRVKVKNPAYVAIAHAKESRAGIIDIVRAGEDDELLTYYPELAREFAIARAKYLVAVNLAEAYYAEHGHKDRKEFCMGVQGHTFSSALIQVKIGKQPSILAAFRAMDAKKLLGLLG